MSLLKFAGLAILAGSFSAVMDAAPRQALRNHVPQAIHESRRIGALSRGSRLDLTIGLPLRNQEVLDAFLARVADPSSVNYRQHMEPSEFAERFGPTQEAYDKLIDFVEANGLTVSARHSNRMLLNVSGPVVTVEKTFHVRMSTWEHKQRGQFIAPDSDPWLDTDVEVLDVGGLDNFVLPAPMDVKANPLAAATPFVNGSGPAGLLIGKDFRAAYAPNVALTGAGQTIGLMEFDGFYTSDVAANFKAAGLPQTPIQVVLMDGFSGAPGKSNIEVTLDIMMAAYMAPGAAIIVYEGTNWNNILNRMATDNKARQLSCSWGFSPINATTEQIFKQMIAQGQTFLQASGDSGAYKGYILPPSDNPNVTVVGGTALTTTGPGGKWLSESTWTGSGGGVSTTYAIPGYQKGMNMAALGGSATMRNIPDVALTAAAQMYLIQNNGQAVSVGGTSAAAPLWAGFIALVNEQATANKKPAVGFMNPAIYAIGAGTTYPADLHDITVGSNGFNAMPGFDLATGWGTPAGQQLIDDLSSVNAAPSFTLSAAPATVSMAVGSSATATIQLTVKNGFSGTANLSTTGLPAGVTATFGAMGTGGASTLTLVASSTAAAGTYQLGLQGVSGTITESTSLSLVISGPAGFTLKTSATALTVAQSAYGSVNVYVMPSNGFNGAVNLTLNSLPAGVTTTFNPASTTTASTLSFAVGASAAAGTSTVTVTGKSGSLAATVSIVLTIAAPQSGFSLTAAPATLSVLPGAFATSTITLTPKDGFKGSAALSVSGLPSGVTAAFSPATTGTMTVITITATTAAAPGQITLIVTGTSGAITARATIVVTVSGVPGFKLSSSVPVVTVAPEKSGSAVIYVASQGGFNGAVALTATGLPAGVTASLGPIGANGTSTLTLTAASTAALKSAPFTVKGTSGNLSATLAMYVTVGAPASPDFSLAFAPASLTVAKGAKGTSLLTITPLNGYSGTIKLSLSGLPSGVGASFTMLNTSGSVQSAFTIGTSAAVGTYKVTLTAVSGSLNHSAVLNLSIVAPSSTSPHVDQPASGVELDLSERSGRNVKPGAGRGDGGTFVVMAPQE